MNRRYDTALFRSRIELIRKLIPDAFIGVDVIAGARGETDGEWLKGRDFIESLPVTRLHVFPYSERPGTKALMIGHNVSQEEKHRRTAELMKISETNTEDYLRVEAPYDPDLINSVTPVLLTDSNISADQ